jgi:hypothetical protein
MCTVTWIHDDDGYQVLCNRDEKRTRRRALPPSIHTRGGVRYIAPSDGDFGGTWIAANEFGLTLCLLNGQWKQPQSPKERHSRGHLLLEWITASSAWEVAGRAQDSDLTPYLPFTLAAFEPGEPAMVVEWNGVEAAVIPYGDALLPLTSSSYQSELVMQRRRTDFQTKLHAAGRLDAELLYFFHESHNGHPDAFSTCMHRPDAETVSFSWVKVGSTNIDFFYTPAAPCRWAAGTHTVLPHAGVRESVLCS